jgi:hypothetical protein
MKESEEKFPLEPKVDIKRVDIEEKGERSYKDMTDKEVKLFKRIYAFTPDAELKTKFGLNDTEFVKLRSSLKEMGVELNKDEAYSRSVAVINPDLKPAKKGETPAYLLARFMNTVSEEERRELMNMYEEGCNPIELMKQLIVIQSSRIIRGSQLEQSSTQLHKTMNEAAADMSTMIMRLEEMENGQKLKLGFDDSFVGLILASQQRRRDYSGDDEDDSY